MADIVITPASVIASAAANIRKEYTAAATITAGQAVYLNTSNAWALLDLNAAATGNGISDLRGIALHGAASGQPLAVCMSDTDFTPGGTLTNGLAVYGSNTAGGITQGDIPTTGAYPVVLGIAKSASKMNLQPFASGAIM